MNELPSDRIAAATDVFERVLGAHELWLRRPERRKASLPGRERVSWRS